MKSTIKRSCIATLALAALAGSAHAAPSIQNSGFYEEGNAGGISDVTIPFTINSTGSVLVVGVYVDSSTSTIIATFNGVAPDMTHAVGRTTSFVFLNPTTGSGSLFLDPTAEGVGVGANFYEVGGANLSTINFVTGSSTITTDTANEFVIGFAGNNGTAVPTVGGSSILTRNDGLLATVMRGGGALASATGTAASPGAQNVGWGSANNGTITYSFDAVLDPLVLGVSQSGGNLDFEWNGADGMQYDLLSSTDLSSDPETWLPYNDGVTTYENLLGNSLSGVLKDGPVRFFVLREEEITPPTP